ncbi:MAG: lipid-binding protein [Bdellovibrionaceae bacterium]|nr:lipid-binding protein [Pseudobdellovibrionaceae bacterium]|tara:strand:- start:1746 stop:2276 length:531 start_codon:yes stop_codon:yes gene_type:complete
MKTGLYFLVVLLMSVSTHAGTIDLHQSVLTWKASKVVGGSFHEGPIMIKKASLKDGKGEVLVDMKSIGEVTLKGKWKKQFIDHIKSSDFFNVEKYPLAKLTVEKIDSGYLHGKLTIKGKTNDISFPVEKTKDGYQGEFGFDRTRFGIIYGSGNFFKNLGDKMIADTVIVKFKLKIK